MHIYIYIHTNICNMGLVVSTGPFRTSRDVQGSWSLFGLKGAGSCSLQRSPNYPLRGVAIP